MNDMVRYSLAWRNPHTTPPGPRVLMAIIVPYGSKCPPEIMSKFEPGSGYAITWELVMQRPIRRWSREARSRVRQRNLKNRIDKKFPLFAEIFIASELEKRPDYYAGLYPEDMSRE
ncbi:hypothetical protein FG152_24685 [Ochrobactrum sp. XJ1]|nr:hypothetical protein [Ochrobactrum sp. XJ1]